MTSMTTSISDRLDARVRGGSGGEPLLTYYDLDSGERTELSAVTFANWAAKTANLLTELAIGDGDAVRLDLTARHPGHWVTFVWAAACWRVGATVSALRPAGRVAAVVVGPDWSGYETSTAAEIIACSLHPLGEGFADPLPTGVTDYSLEVRGQPDSYAGVAPSGSGPAWVDDEREVSAADLLGVGASEAPQRRLVRPGDPWPTVSAGLLTPLNSGGSSVIVVAEDAERIGHIAESERAIL